MPQLLFIIAIIFVLSLLFSPSENEKFYTETKGEALVNPGNLDQVDDFNGVSLDLNEGEPPSPPENWKRIRGIEHVELWKDH